MGPQLTKQVVLVIGTSFSKTLVIIINATVTDTKTTILVLLIVALQGNILRRFHKVGIRPLI